MNNEIYQWVVLLLLPFILVGAYVQAFLKSKKKFGKDYMDVVVSFQWKCLKGLVLILLYCGVSVYQGGWSKLLEGVAFSASAFTFFTMALHEMACGISINHNHAFEKKKVAMILRVIIVLQAISLVSLVLMFQATKVHWAATASQVILLLLSLIAFYTVGSIVNLVKIGYSSKGGDA